MTLPTAVSEYWLRSNVGWKAKHGEAESDGAGLMCTAEAVASLLDLQGDTLGGTKLRALLAEYQDAYAAARPHLRRGVSPGLQHKVLDTPQHAPLPCAPHTSAYQMVNEVHVSSVTSLSGVPSTGRRATEAANVEAGGHRGGGGLRRAGHGAADPQEAEEELAASCQKGSSGSSVGGERATGRVAGRGGQWPWQELLKFLWLSSGYIGHRGRWFAPPAEASLKYRQISQCQWP